VVRRRANHELAGLRGDPILPDSQRLTRGRGCGIIPSGLALSSMLLATPANAEAAQCAGSPGTTRSRLDVLVTEFGAPRDDAVVTLDGDDPSRL
jgi:hypothetical protein